MSVAEVLHPLGRELARFADALFPPACALCGAPAASNLRGVPPESAFACRSHRLLPKPIHPRCDRCAACLPAMMPDGQRCAACRIDAPRYQRLIALADYDRGAAVRDWILAFKHGGRADLARPLAAMLAAHARGAVEDAGWLAAAPGASGIDDGVLVTAVPLHPLRRWSRGYDQAALLGRAFAFELGCPWRPTLCRRRATRSQGAMGARSRRANVQDAFVVRSRLTSVLRGRTVLLVDDVVTSGATVDECTRQLHVAGARRVWVVALARAAPPARGETPAEGIGGVESSG